MADTNNHILYSAAMIDRYHKGELSASERHAFEKAAMDDPFLADALEGYAVPGVNIATDINELKARLARRTGDDKVIALAGSSRSFPWLRAAAIIVFLLGGGLLVYQLGFKNKGAKEPIAKVEETNKQVPQAIDSNKNYLTVTGTDKEIKKDIENPKPGIKTENNGLVTFYNTDKVTTAIRTDSLSSGITSKGDLNEVVVTNASKPPAVAPVVISPLRSREVKDDKALKKEVATVFQHDTKEPVKDADEDGVKDKFEKAAGSTEVARNNQGLISNRQLAQRNNLFNGRVTDVNNNPLPFANVLNTSDSVGTYADARGYFNLSSPDSVLNVQVRSLGYNETNLQLRNGAVNNQVYMKEDLSISPRVLDQTKRNTTRRAFEPVITVEESEPADGWSNYDTYILNNLQVPSEIKDKEGEVEISFEVTKKGEPIHFKVEKSLCTKCDEEAIRLVKEGPKWKRKGKKGRGSVTVPFSSSH